MVIAQSGNTVDDTVDQLLRCSTNKLHAAFIAKRSDDEKGRS